jgi:hypothetical protein
MLGHLYCKSDTNIPVTIKRKSILPEAMLKITRTARCQISNTTAPVITLLQIMMSNFKMSTIANYIERMTSPTSSSSTSMFTSPVDCELKESQLFLTLAKKQQNKTNRIQKCFSSLIIARSLSSFWPNH